MALVALNPSVDGTILIGATAKNFRDDFADFGLTEAQILAADVIHLRVYDNTIRYRYAGTSVTATTGYAVDAGNEIELVGKQTIRKFSMIRETGDANVWFTLLKDS